MHCSTSTSQWALIEEQLPKLPQTTKKRRTKVPFRPTTSMNYFILMKKCIGKDVSKLSMPVDFNEPLSALQRLTEDLEYSYLLDKAAAETRDMCKRVAYVAAFVVSNYSSLAVRNTKPFNPLLGETFEFDRRDDRGFYSISEQVSHHPPTSAMFSKGKSWILKQAYTFSTDVKGRAFHVHQKGKTIIQFKDCGTVFSFDKLPFSRIITNPVSGKMTTECSGQITIHTSTNEARCALNFHENSPSGKTLPSKVTGTITDAKGHVQYKMDGFWNMNLLLQKLEPDGEIEAESLVWQRFPYPQDSDKMHNFTQFAIELNEPEEGVAPTDSRLRPDQREMENGEWKRANHIKSELENQQRKRRAEHEKLGKVYTPKWFTKAAPNGVDLYEFNIDYLQCRAYQNWSSCPSIFGT
ncbi:unnamed protein product [Bursaphelenchus okinawaensis]|uniref:Oxysterol-binding protein n=1 Tax=Bursaphelenchus okinawaensis TaxID=465554 RepID=A0A811L7B4_9BILA|nr:unnamed protein product [Bursaphelenchus okinawaensis]CAG9117827.1 unnamed protein product [Bursaphelenchus okinawaensis]